MTNKLDVNSFLIEENASLIEAMKQLDSTAHKILFVTKNKKFVATITDGDIRRWILKNGDLNAVLSAFANYNPIKIGIHDKLHAKSIMVSHGIDSIPVVDENGHIEMILFSDSEIDNFRRLKTPVVIMAGGKGTRLYPYTKILPKPLIPVGEKPILELILENFDYFQIEKYYIIVNHKKNMIKAYFHDSEMSKMIEFIDEDIPLGTGGGLVLLKNKIESTFFLSNCDILIYEDYAKIYDFHKMHNNLITIVGSVKTTKVPYGVIELTTNGKIANLKEKPEISFIVNTGLYVVEPQVINELEDFSVIGFPDLIDKYRKLGLNIGVYPISEESWSDMGELDELRKMRDKIYE